jgi:hypothetical protein
MIVSFKQNDPGDLDALAERIGPVKAGRVAELARHRFLVWCEADNFRAGENNPKACERGPEKKS